MKITSSSFESSSSPFCCFPPRDPQLQGNDLAALSETHPVHNRPVRSSQNNHFVKSACNLRMSDSQGGIFAFSRFPNTVLRSPYHKYYRHFRLVCGSGVRSMVHRRLRRRWRWRTVRSMFGRQNIACGSALLDAHRRRIQIFL
jgi:hypothetical protein